MKNKDMFVQLVCPNRDADQINELYEVIAALCEREGVQIEDRKSRVEILVCPQGKILVDEVDNTLFLSANTRHAGPGFHAFVVDFFKDIEEEVPGEYELIDDLEYDKDEDFDRIVTNYRNELDYLISKLKSDEDFREKNYLFDETFYLPFQSEGRINTSIGDMAIEDLEMLSDDELMDSFYVWNDWDRDGRFYRNAALTLLAKEGAGIYSTMNDETEKIANEIADYIEIAYEKDPDLALPIREYRQLVDLLKREDRLADAISLDAPAVQYRSDKVYHLFENVRVVAPGNAERNYDPVNQSMNLTAPYTDPADWSWILQASRQPGIITDLDELSGQPAIDDHGQQLQLDVSRDNDFYQINAIITDDDQKLYLHALARNAKEAELMEECIKKSGFSKEKPGGQA